MRRSHDAVGGLMLAGLMLSVQGVVVRFGDRTVLDGVDLAVADGEIVAVQGPSGGGKTTLLRVIAGLLRPDAGRVAWDGADLAGVPAHERRFGLMFQDNQLFPHRDVGRNVGFGLRRIAAAGRLASRPRVSGTMQKLQNRSQPSITVTKARPGVAGSRSGCRSGRSKRSLPELSRVRAARVPRLAASTIAGTQRRLWVPKTKSTCGKRRSRLSPCCCATQPPTPSSRPGEACFHARSTPRSL